MGFNFAPGPLPGGDTTHTSSVEASTHTARASPRSRPALACEHGGVPQVAEQLRAAIAADGPVPYNLLVILKRIGQAGEILLRRGWEIESIDADGAGFLWPPSFVDEDEETEGMEMPVTRLVLRSNLTTEYTLGGCPVLTLYPPVSLGDILTESAALRAVEAYRRPAYVAAGWNDWAPPGGPAGA